MNTHMLQHRKKFITKALPMTCALTNKVVHSQYFGESNDKKSYSKILMR